MPRGRPAFFILVIAVGLYFTFKYSQPQHVNPPLAARTPTSALKESSAQEAPEVPTTQHKDQFTRRIVAVGDLHGDLPNALKVLQMSGVISESGNWTGNVDFFVQTGDIIDRGDDTLQLYELMERLRVEAKAAGGTVLSNLGNHEFMNAIGDWRYVYQSEIKTFGSVADRQKMLTTGWVGRAWRQNYTLATRLPLHTSLGDPNTDYDPATSSLDLSHAAIAFMHGGLSPTYEDMTPFPSRINKIGHSLLARLQDQTQPPPHPPSPYPGLPHDTPPEERELYGTNGPLWYRGLALDEEADVCAVIDEILNKIGCRRVILGHTPDFEHVNSRCGGKVIIIDTGISHAYGGALSALSITYTLTPSGGQSEDAPWIEKEIVKAIYASHNDTLAINERTVYTRFRD
ncbi:hypothetical protein BOTBODRAFT_38814 [Botryobasidium botryosum FD-172 SS1]|uniref:Calcineurin-like phosphoesterase domain-containing protein n=1 Tax=Botryobasidium botryosum (strain FD-172 SS1) TaxID=930990 RepID=A0A067LW76_BOTB1|nr:hypothetical protein BOTBODRAFT_38814 [Botryobasidium botryosum FD-172 SS1]